MTANYDNTAVNFQGVIRNAATGVPLTVNADGSINITLTGTRDATGTTAPTKDAIPGTVRDPSSSVPMVVNSNGSFNGAQ